MKKNIIIVLVIIILVICASIFIKILVENRQEEWIHNDDVNFISDTIL